MTAAVLIDGTEHPWVTRLIAAVEGVVVKVYPLVIPEVVGSDVAVVVSTVSWDCQYRSFGGNGGVGGGDGDGDGDCFDDPVHGMGLMCSADVEELDFADVLPCRDHRHLH